MKYIGRINKIDHIKASKTEGAYMRVYFTVKDEEKSTPEKKVYFWAKTDIVPTYRNYKHWKNILEVGNVLSGLVLRNPTTIDADSVPSLLGFLEADPYPNNS